MGACLDKLLCPIPERKCKIIGRAILGVKLANGTFTGILGELQSGAADMYLKGEPSHVYEPDWLRTTPPFYTERIVFGQLITPKNVTNFFDLGQNFNLGQQIILSYCAVLAGLLLVCIALKRAYGRLSAARPADGGRRDERLNGLGRKVNRFLTSLQRAGSLPSFGVLFLFLNLFVWFTLLFLTNNIKTNKVVLGGCGKSNKCVRLVSDLSIVGNMLPHCNVLPCN